MDGHHALPGPGGDKRWEAVPHAEGGGGGVGGGGGGGALPHCQLGVLGRRRGGGVAGAKRNALAPNRATGL